MSVEARNQKDIIHGKAEGMERKPQLQGQPIPLLHFGNNNNFHNFWEALLKVALREYGHLGKLIELEEYY